MLLFTQLYVSVPDPPLAVTNILPSLAPETVIGFTVIGAVNIGFSIIVVLTTVTHPVTSEINNSKSQIKITLEAVKQSKINVLTILPNNDAGFSEIIRELKSSKIQYVESLKIEEYINLLKNSCGLIGNSSSGIHESSTFNVPTINIGSRQNGRLRPENVIDVGHDKNQIIKAIEKCKKIKTDQIKYKNPYGDGKSAKRIISIIKKLDLSSNIIQKQITY